MILSEAKGRDEEIRLSVYRTESGAEVDFIVEKGRETFAIEVKAMKIGYHSLINEILGSDRIRCKADLDPYPRVTAEEVAALNA